MPIFDFGGKQKSPRDIAKERLQVMLVYDRIHIDPGLVDALKEDLIKTISRYSKFDVDNLAIDLSNRDNQIILRIDIPIKG
ncbi:MAG: cell division topological specificity factor MinE [Dictyoglomus sp.]|nr:cell division topological specificity factor MinE [Dictyoglomus sp.]MCX7941747.1 cell division topological specificity factor MinE [Dictyoglomaceae bacterium]MDW8189040.1 cell division topological specificity factor MinE [Dictyoglomus sp.]